MPHRCLRCGNVYNDRSMEIITGCSCSSKLFLYVRDDKKSKELKDKNQIKGKKDNLIDSKDNVQRIILKNNDTPVILDIETIRIVKPGKYEIDLQKLMARRQIVFKLSEGKYYIDLISGFGNKVKDDNLEF